MDHPVDYEHAPPPTPACSHHPPSSYLAQYIILTFILSGFFWAGLFLVIKWMKDRVHTDQDISHQETPHPPHSPDPRPPANPLFVRAAERFPTFRYPMPRNNPNTQCPVCSEPFEEGAQVTLLLPCMHYMHKECLARMLAAHRRCSLCRAEMHLEDGLPQVEPLR